MPSGLATLKTRADFLRVAASRSKAVMPGLLLQAAPRPADPDAKPGASARLRVGFTASRKVGNAVARSLAKRRLRAVAAEILPHQGRPGTDYVLVARGATGKRDYAALVADLEAALRRVAQDGAGRRPSAA